MRRIKQFLLTCFAIVPCMAMPGEPIPINKITDYLDIGAEAMYYSAPRNQVQVQTMPNGAVKIMHNGTGVLHFPYQYISEDFITRKNFLHDYFFKFTVTNNGYEKDSVLFYPGVVMQAELYRADSATGQLYPLNDFYVYTTQIGGQQLIYPFIRLAPGETQTMIAKPKFRFYNYTDWKPTLVRQEQVLLLTYTYKIKPELNYLLLSLFFLGVFTAMFVYAMIKAYQTRLREFMFYGFSVLFFLLYFTYQLTLLFNFMSWYHGLDLFMKQFFQISAYIFYMLFVTFFLDIPKNLPVLNRVMMIIYVMLVLYLGVTCCTAFNDKYFELNMVLFNGVRIVLLVYSLYAIPVLFSCRVPLARYVAWGALSVAVFSALAMYFSNVPEGRGPFFRAIGGPITFFKIGLVIQQVFFTMGLAKKSQLEEGYRIKAVEMLRIENEKKEFEKFMAVMETKEKERTRIAQEIHDDIGSGLTTIRLLSEIAQGRKDNGHSAEMEKISASANELIENMNEIIWSFNARNDTLPNLVAYIRRYVVSYFEPTDIRVRIDIPVDIPPVQISGDFRRSVFLVVKESLHNIMKHARATEILLKMDVRKGLFISLKDNGKGFNGEEVKLFSNGLRSMKERMQNIGGTFNISGQGGTEVTLTVPV